MADCSHLHVCVYDIDCPHAHLGAGTHTYGLAGKSQRIN